MWQELQAVTTEISELEKEKRHIGDTVKALVVSNGSLSPVYVDCLNVWK